MKDRPARRPSDPESRVLRIPGEDAPRVVDVLVEAFRDYPVMRYVVGPDVRDFDTRLRKAVSFFVTVRVLRREPLFGIEAHGPPAVGAPGIARRNDEAIHATLGAAAIVSFPDGPDSPPDVARHREALWADLGADARARYERCGEVWSAFRVEPPHVHLNMIGVRATMQGKGLGRILLEHVQDFSRHRPGSEGVTLTTEDPVNVRLYERVGYEVIGHAKIAPDLETWGMFRRN